MDSLGEPVHTESAHALETSCVLATDQATFRAVLREHPNVALRVLDDLAAAPPESVSRVLVRLPEDGIIDLSRRWAAVLDRRQLEAVAQDREVPVVSPWSHPAPSALPFLAPERLVPGAGRRMHWMLGE